MRFLIIRAGSIPRTQRTSLQVIEAHFIRRKVGYRSIKARIDTFLQFRQCQYIDEMLFQLLLIRKHRISQHRLRASVSPIRLSVRPDRSGQILGVFGIIVSIGAEKDKLQIWRKIEVQAGVRAEIRNIITVVHFHPCQWIGNLTGRRYLIPCIRSIILMIRKRRIESRCRIERLLQVDQVTVFLHRTEKSQLALDKLTEYILRHIHVRGKKFHAFIQHYSLPVEVTQRHTIPGSLSSSIKSDVVILLDTQLFNFFLKIRIVTFIQNRQSMCRSHIAVFCPRKHIQMTIGMRNTETSVIIDARLARNTFFSRDIDYTRSTSGTVLCCFGSIFQDSKAFNIRRVNRSKHT